MKKKSTAVRFNGLFLFSYAAGAIGTTQTIPYLVSMGFEGTQKGIILSWNGDLDASSRSFCSAICRINSRAAAGFS